MKTAKPKPKGKRKGRPGRKCEYTKAEADRYVKLIEQGLSPHRAQQYLGRDHKTIEAWADKFPQFSQALTRAEPKRELWHLKNIDKASKAGDWRASHYQLAVMNPDKYSLKQKHEMSGQVKIPTLNMTADEWFRATTEEVKESIKTNGNGV